MTNTKFVRVAVLDEDDRACRFAHNDQEDFGIDPFDFEMHVGSKHVMIRLSDETFVFGSTAKFQQPASRSGWLTISVDNFEFSFAFLEKDTLLVSKGPNYDGESIFIDPAKHILAQFVDGGFEGVQWVLERKAKVSDAEILEKKAEVEDSDTSDSEDSEDR